MNQALQNLLENLDALKLYMSFQDDSFKITNRFFRENEVNDYKSLPSAKLKRFNYNAYVISLYGLFERYIETTLTNYLEELCIIVPDYQNLPNQIKDINLTKNIEVLSNLKFSKHKNVNPENLISKLNDNLNNNKSILNNESFVHHKSNFRSTVIDEYFQNIGVSGVGSSIRQYSPIRELIEKDFTDIFNKKSSSLFFTIDDLADRRNEIAHGVENIDILNASILLNYIEFISAFSKSLNALLYDSLYPHICIHKSKTLNIINVFNNSILCCNLDFIPIDISSKIIIERPGSYPRFIKAEILDIQINGVSVQNVSGLNSVDVGLKLNTRIKNTNIFSLEI